MWHLTLLKVVTHLNFSLGFFGEVFRGLWNGTDVAIKVFLEQDLTTENMKDFCNEISILRFYLYLLAVTFLMNWIKDCFLIVFFVLFQPTSTPQWYYLHTELSLV